MSTVDSLLLLVSSSVIRDTYQKIFKSNKNERVLSRYGKYITILIGLLAVFIAILEPRVIFDFVLLSWSGLGSAFGPVIIGILYNKKITWEGVIAGMSGGFLASTIWVTWFKEEYYGLYEAIPGFIMGFLLTFGVSWLTSLKKQRKIH
jgi:sodium/proline symporter